MLTGICNFKGLLKSRFYYFLGLLTLLLLVTFAACTPTGQNPNTQTAGNSNMPQEVSIGYQVIPNAEVLAKSLGLVEEAFPSVKIEWKAFPAGWKVNAAMLDGEVDIGMVGSLPVSTAIAQGLPLKVYIVHNIIGDNAALAVTQSSGIKTMTDLPGKKIAVPFGSTSHFSLISAIQQSGIDPKSVSILDMSISEIISAWNSDTIDGSFVWQTTLSKLLSAKGTIITTAGALSDKGGTTADLGTVSTEFLATYPDFLTGFIDALKTATAFYQEDPQAAAEAVANDVSLTPEQSLSIMKEIIWLDVKEQSSTQYMGTPDDPGKISQVLKDSADFMAAQKAIPPAPKLEVFQQALFNQPFQQPET